MLPRMMCAKARMNSPRIEEQYYFVEKGNDTFVAPGTPPNGTQGSPWRTSPASKGDLTQHWMGLLDDEIPLPALTIPGTHDSAAYTHNWPFVATQHLKIVGQLNAGIRYFDLRCGLRADVVEMVHGPTYLGLTLEKVLHHMYTWLSRHPTETLIVQIKEDRRSERSSVHFMKAISDVVTMNSDRWRTANTIPTLGDLRGRIQLFRRFAGPSLLAYGMDVSEWEDNPADPFTIYTLHDVRITIQDHYKFSGAQTLPSLITKKGGNVSELLRRASNDKDRDHWYINFVSAYELNVFFQLTPHEIAVGGYWGFRWIVGMNVRLMAYLTARTPGRERFGIVAMDFPEQGTDGLLASLILTNFEPAIRSTWRSLAGCILMLVLCIAIWLLLDRCAVLR
ncbi:hypothetical protein LTR37_006753 [Vermiconidia calcicola]|uniref:Uncharacterized protein n=1 Tax=Vermiconidia calcicola TaxID=1690605 RepID=A0ACC3NG80_9PEZI|nr:hypothetical protein LTR37_006753 [Vermiconidia calcicola]